MANNNYEDFFESEEYKRFIEILQNGSMDDIGNIMDDSSSIFEDKVKSQVSNSTISKNNNSEISTKNEQKYIINDVEDNKYESMVKRNSKNRCGKCNSKLKLINYTCKCKIIFCSKHRLPEHHTCNFNHKLKAKEILRENNPKIIKEKLNKI